MYSGVYTPTKPTKQPTLTPSNHWNLLSGSSLSVCFLSSALYRILLVYSYSAPLYRVHGGTSIRGVGRSQPANLTPSICKPPQYILCPHTTMCRLKVGYLLLSSKRSLWSNARKKLGSWAHRVYQHGRVGGSPRSISTVLYSVRRVHSLLVYLYTCTQYICTGYKYNSTLFYAFTRTHTRKKPCPGGDACRVGPVSPCGISAVAGCTRSGEEESEGGWNKNSPAFAVFKGMRAYTE